jgi:hypothetical protein
MNVAGLGRTTAWATAGFLLLQIGWMVVMAPFAGIDEHDHAIRSSSVSEGHLFVPERHPRPTYVRGDLIEVRGDIAAAANPACSRLPYTRVYDCVPSELVGDGDVLIGSAAARYNPTYYLIAGWASKAFHGNAALYAMRAVTVLLCAGLFAVAVRLTGAWARTRWPLVTLVLAALPTTVYSASIATPNGVEIMAGLTFWTAMVHRLVVPRPETWSYAALTLSGALLVNTHTLGMVWLALTLAAGLLLVGVRRFLDYLRPRGAGQVLLALGGAAAIAFEAGWVLLARTNDPSGPVVVTTNVWTLLPREMLLWPLQAIGAFPYRDEPAPLITYAAALVVLIGIATIAVAATRAVPRLRLTLGFVFVTSYAVPIALTVATFSRLGLNWQGRYGMPYTAGLLLLLGLALDRAGPRIRRPILEIGLLAWIFAGVSSQLSVRHQQASDLVLQRTGWWTPPAILVVLLAIGAWLAWRRALAAGAELHRDETASAAPGVALGTASNGSAHQTIP